MLKYRWPIIIVSFVITMFFGWQMLDIDIDPDIKNNIPQDMKSRVNTDKIEELFGRDNMLLVLFESENILNEGTLKRIKLITKKMERMKDFDRIMSPSNSKSIKSEDGMMVIDPAIRRIPRNEEQKNRLRSELINNPLVYGVTISEDFTMAAIVADLNAESSDNEVLNKVNTLVEKIPGDEIVHIGGMPAIRARINEDVKNDMGLLLPAGLLIMLVMLFIFFKQLRGVLLPFGVVMMSIIIGMGLIPLLGWKLSMISILLPIILIAVANDYGIHLLARYQELINKEPDLTAYQIAGKVFKDLKKPILLTAFTTIVGILALLSHVIIPAKQLGILASVSIGTALILSLLFIPAVLSLLKKPASIHKRKHKSGLLDRILQAAAGLVNRYPNQIIFVSLLITAGMMLGINQLKVDANVENFFSENHPVKKSSTLINDNFGGSQMISVLIEDDIKDPDVLKRIEDYESEIKNFDGVGDAYSITTPIKEMNKAIMGNEAEDYQFPDSRNGVAQLLELYYMSGDPDDFEKFVDFDFEKARIMIRLKDASSSNVTGIVEQIEEMTQNDESVKIIGGDGLVTAELSNTVVDGQVSSLAIALVSVLLIMMIIFRSATAGFIASIPLAASVIVLFGLMGILNIPLDIATALLSSVMIGVGVDYTIHFIWRYREEIQLGKSMHDAVLITLTTTGKGITYNALSVIIGFSILLISAFSPIKFFGFLIVVSIFVCLIGAMLLVPALILVLKPKFLEQSNKEFKTEYKNVA